MNLSVICAHCGRDLGTHNSTAYYSKWYKMWVPHNYCAGPVGRMNWGDGPGTVFKEKCVEPEKKYHLKK